MTLPQCSCGRAPVELGTDLCGWCRHDYEVDLDRDRQYQREWESAADEALAEQEGGF